MRRRVKMRLVRSRAREEKIRAVGIPGSSIFLHARANAQSLIFTLLRMYIPTFFTFFILHISERIWYKLYKQSVNERKGCGCGEDGVRFFNQTQCPVVCNSFTK